MARTQRPLVVILVLLAGGAAFGAWYLGRAVVESPAATASGPPPAPPAADAPPERSSVAAPPAPVDDVDAADTTVAWPVLVALELVESAELPRAADVPALGTGATATLRGKVVGHSGNAVPGARVQLMAGPNEGREIVANEQGEFGATGLQPGLALARIQAPGLPGALRQVRLRKGVETLLNVSFQHAAQVWITVHGDDDAGLEGVEVRLDGQVRRTDENGDAYFTAMTPGRDLAIELEKEGYATYGGLLGVSLGHDVPKGAVQYRMTKACRLSVIVSASAGGKGDALVVVMPDNPLAQASSAKTTLGGHPVNATDYPWHRVSPKRVAVGSVAHFDDLPEQSVEVRVFHEGSATKQRTLSAHLKPSKPQTLTVELQPAPRLIGRATIDGEPADRAQIVLEAPDRSAATLQYFSEGPMFLESMPIPALPVAVQTTEADSNGEFVLSTWPELARARYLRVTSRDGRFGAVELVQGSQERIDVALEPVEAGSSRIELEFPGRFQGLPVQLTVNGEPRPPVVLPASENLLVDDVSAGTWTIEARWNGRGLIDPPESFDVADVAVRSIPLPEDAILGQDEETLARARGH